MRRQALRWWTVFLLGASSALLSTSASTVAAYVVVGSAARRTVGTVLRPPPVQHRRRRPPTPSAALGRMLAVRRGGGSRSSTSTQLEGMSALVATVDAFWKGSNPLVAAAVVCATKASLADLVAQRRQQRLQTAAATASAASRSSKLDFRRLLSFMTYGALYQGAVQELIYNNLYTYWFGSARTASVVAKKVLFDAFFHNALICIPMAYAVKSFVFQYSLKTGLQQYLDDVRYHGLLLKYYAIWMPVNAMIFTIVPPHWRITVMAVVSFFWMIILSTISSRSRE